jgi:hypothetical protein
MHSFEINNNIDIIMEADSKKESQTWINKVSTGYDAGRVGDVFGGSVSNGFGSDGDRVSEWLWTLHRIGLLLREFYFKILLNSLFLVYELLKFLVLVTLLKTMYVTCSC